MKFASIGLMSLLVAAAGTFGASSALAQGTWNLGGSSCNASGTSNTVCTTGSVSATMGAYGNTGSGGVFVQQALTNNDPLGFGAQFGNETDYNSHHAFDNLTASTTNCGTSSSQTSSNCGGTVELMLINFNAQVNLASIAIGYWSPDSDISVYRYDGASNPTLTSSSVANIGTATASIGTGWSLVSSQDVDVSGVAIDNPNDASTALSARRMDLNAGAAKYSSWWLVSTYFGASVNALERGDDAFKILNFAAATCTGNSTITGGITGQSGGNAGNNGNGGICTPNGTGVPEPGSLALAGLALVGVFAVRRRPAASRASARAA